MLSLFEICQLSCQDKQNGKETYCLLSTWSLCINLKDASSHTSIDSLGLYLSPEHLLNFLSNLYITPWLGEIFKFMVFRLLENVFVIQKI